MIHYVIKWNQSIENKQTNIAKSISSLQPHESLLHQIPDLFKLPIYWAKVFKSWLTPTHDLTLTKVFCYSCIKMFLPVFYVVWYYSNSKTKDKQYQQKTSLISYNTEIKILANPELAYLCFEQPGPELHHL